jgi:hypothetical protein
MIQGSGLLLTAFALTFLALGCATRPKLVLRSAPEGAEVTNRGGDVLGVTPLTLEGDALEKVRSGSTVARAEFRVGKKGYQSRQLSVELQNETEFELSLDALDSKSFGRMIAQEYSREVNALVREALAAQAQLLSKRTTQGEERLQKLTEQYPTVGGPQVLLAQIALAKGDRELARKLIRRALGVDPDDGIAQRLGKQLDVSLVDQSGGAKP